MSKLLSAGFSRLFKSRSFYIMTAFSVLIPLYETAVNIIKHINDPSLPYVPQDHLLNAEFVIFVFSLSAFTSIFIGRENSDKTIRNKLSAGYTRSEIWLSNFIVCFSAGIISQAVYVISLTVLSVPLCGMYSSSAETIIAAQLIGVSIIAAFISIFNAAAMLISIRSAAVSVSMIIAFLFFFCGETIYSSAANERIFYENAVNITGGTAFYYRMCSFLADVFPMCQAFDLAYLRSPAEQDKILEYIISDIIITIIVSALGIFIFRRKDLK